MTKSIILLVVLAALCTGCASNKGLYDWGNYEDNLFNYYHKPATQDAIIEDHLAFLASLESKQIKPAPGLLAEAGTLLLLKGDREKAIEFYQKEHDAWPESQAMMSTLIANLKEQK